MVSVVIPAHNEEAVVASGLDTLLSAAEPGEFDVIVVANGCSDGTARAAARPGVRVLETATPGKAHALRLGDAACRTFPRVYLDADVRLDAESVRALVSAAGRPGVLACAPEVSWDLTGVGWPVRRVLFVHEALILPGRALAGVGVYVLTAEGHRRVFPLPDVISDDGYVDGCFAGDERVVVTEARSLVRPARTVRAHLARRVRVRQGNRQLAELGRPARRLDAGSLRRLLLAGAISPLDAACYLAVLAADRLLTRLRGDRRGWGTDSSSRHGESAGEPTAAS
ncbi:glycosyltransferase [Nonomuraea sp. SBT364]|uniref:glycosyltransferase n=1 Tax=Nonomuraea sp. SBT364 TaxID=1580530 RepID=UPI00066D4433|nr:glycosyltransferase family 2 protein [Nonomuraea sp. SBT364]